MTPKPWEKLRWGVLWTTRRDPRGALVGQLWDRAIAEALGTSPVLGPLPPRKLLFLSREQARAWCQREMARRDRSTLVAGWRYRPVRVRERVTVVRACKPTRRSV